LDDRATFRSPFDRLMRVRTWAAERLQTVYRTVVGMMKHRKALDLLLEAELPSLSPADRQALLNAKFRLVLAVQTYAGAPYNFNFVLSNCYWQGGERGKGSS
jgi:hypothetical protein